MRVHNIVYSPLCRRNIALVELSKWMKSRPSVTDVVMYKSRLCNTAQLKQSTLGVNYLQHAQCKPKLTPGLLVWATWLMPRWAAVVRNNQLSILENVINVPCAHVGCHSGPEISNSLCQFFFRCWLDSPANVILHCSPYSFYWVEIGWLRWHWPVINFIGLHPLTGALTFVFRIIVHHQSIALGISSAYEW